MMPAEGQCLQALDSVFTRHDLLSAWHAVIVSWHRYETQAYLLPECVSMSDIAVCCDAATDEHC